MNKKLVIFGHWCGEFYYKPSKVKNEK